MNNLYGGPIGTHHSRLPTPDPNESPLKIFEKRAWAYQSDCPNIFSTPYYLGNGLSYKVQILYGHS